MPINTHREKILDAIIAAIGTRTPAGQNVFRSRVLALTRGQLPAIIVKPGAEVTTPLSQHAIKRELTIHVEFHARGEIPDQAADAVIAVAHKNIMADDTLGGIVTRIVDSGMEEPEFADADDIAVMVVLNFTAVYLTSARDITSVIS